MGTGIVGIRQHSTTLVPWIQLNSFVSDLDQTKDTKDSLGSWDGFRASLWGNLWASYELDPNENDASHDVVWCQAAMVFLQQLKWKKHIYATSFRDVQFNTGAKSQPFVKTTNKYHLNNMQMTLTMRGPFSKRPKVKICQSIICLGAWMIFHVPWFVPSSRSDILLNAYSSTWFILIDEAEVQRKLTGRSCSSMI